MTLRVRKLARASAVLPGLIVVFFVVLSAHGPASAAEEVGRAAENTDAAADAGSAEARAKVLRSRHSAAQSALATSEFGRPLILKSSDADNKVRGEVLAVIDQPMSRLRSALTDPNRWCEILLLTPSIAGCRAQQGSPITLAVRLARRYDQDAKDAFAASFAYTPVASTLDYFAVELDADKGPVGTTKYRIEVEGLALDGGHSVLRMSYSYRYGLKASLATKAYLATKGGDKVGFTRESPDGDPNVLIGGMRGSVERNAMRYYLAIETNVAQGDSAEPLARFEASLDAWLSAIGRYPRQLKETDADIYRRAKREQFATRLTRND